MKKVVLIACAGQKQDVPAPAGEIYTSTLFRSSLRYAQQMDPDGIFVLSAKHELLPLDEVIEPYDVTLNAMPAAAVRTWAERVAAQLAERFDLAQDHFVILAGKRYRKYLLPHLHSYEVPMEGLRIGEQLKFLKERT